MQSTIFVQTIEFNTKSPNTLFSIIENEQYNMDYKINSLLVT